MRRLGLLPLLFLPCLVLLPSAFLEPLPDGITPFPLKNIKRKEPHPQGLIDERTGSVKQIDVKDDCFLNSAIQVLRSLPAVADYLRHYHTRFESGELKFETPVERE